MQLPPLEAVTWSYVWFSKPQLLLLVSFSLRRFALGGTIVVLPKHPCSVRSTDGASANGFVYLAQQGKARGWSPPPPFSFYIPLFQIKFWGLDKEQNICLWSCWSCCMFFWPKVKLNKTQRKQTKKDLECTICNILKTCLIRFNWMEKTFLLHLNQSNLFKGMS